MRLTRLGVAGLGATIMLAGCTTSGTGTPPVASAPVSASSTESGTPATAATTATTPATAWATVEASTLATRLADGVTAAGSGKADITSPSGVTGTSRFRFPTPSTSQSTGTVTIQGQTLEVVGDNGTIYMKGFPPALTGGKPWVKVDPNGADPVSQALRETGANLGDPRSLAGQWKGGTATVVEQTASLTRYRLDGTPAQQASPSSVTLTLDAQDRPQQLAVTAGAVTLVTTYGDWGAPVEITLPPADQVGTLS